jgi:transcriptional regulator with GAF, ATPase, and Fis domain
MRIPTQFSIDQVVVGHSARMRAIFDFVKVVSRSDSSVIITGESGTGKEVIANMLHHQSARRHQPFVAVSCALFSETLIETELFGHERGAFTGAIKDKPGRFELAQGGTLFLDDIDDVPLSMQVKLLRALQNREVERVGGTRTIPVNVRIITGTKRDLKQLVTEGKFREDLYYRLNVLPIVLPPLRERREDIPVLIDHFLRRFSRDRGIDVPDISPVVPDAPALPAMEPPKSISLDDRLKEVESNLIGWALKVADGNKSKAAELLNIKRSTLGDRIARCGIAVQNDSSEPMQASA